MTEANDFTQFCQPVQNDDGNWYVRSVDQDYIGDYRYLVFGLETGMPKVLTIMEAHNGNYDILCGLWAQANDELKFYYEYHKRPDLYNVLMYSLNTAHADDSDIVESQVMQF